MLFDRTLSILRYRAFALPVYRPFSATPHRARVHSARRNMSDSTDDLRKTDPSTVPNPLGEGNYIK